VIEQNLILSETEFDEFQHYCHEKGFDLSYYNSISGSEKEIQQQKFDEPAVIKLLKYRGHHSAGIEAAAQRAHFASNCPPAFHHS
jgi:hypothetical protein